MTKFCTFINFLMWFRRFINILINTFYFIFKFIKPNNLTQVRSLFVKYFFLFAETSDFAKTQVWPARFSFPLFPTLLMYIHSIWSLCKVIRNNTGRTDKLNTAGNWLWPEIYIYIYIVSKYMWCLFYSVFKRFLHGRGPQTF